MLKFGEYARTNKGDIFIYANVVDENGNKLDYIMKLVNGGPIKYYLNKDENIVKHSKNIIDLIEVGDYVNGHKIIMDLKQSRKHYHTIDCFVTAKGYTFEENEIETILTKEQYKSNCYTVERKE